jgi:hypothetical protein
MILTSSEPANFVWGRVAGDVLDLVTLMPALAENNPRRKQAMAATALVVAVTMLDAYAASLASRPPLTGRTSTGGSVARGILKRTDRRFAQRYM